eukprot:17693-Heterococcus_DN1.PRE.1
MKPVGAIACPGEASSAACNECDYQHFATLQETARGAALYCFDSTSALHKKVCQDTCKELMSAPLVWMRVLASPDRPADSMCTHKHAHTLAQCNQNQHYSQAINSNYSTTIAYK